MRPNRGFLLRNQKSEKIPNRFLKSILQNQRTNFPLSEIRYLQTKIRNPFEIRNPKSETRNPKPEIGNRKLEIANWESQLANRNSQIATRKSQFANQISKIRNQKSEIGNRKSEIRNQKSEIRNQKSEIGNRKSEIRNQNQKSENRNQKSEIRNQNSEIRNQKSEIGNQKSEIRNKIRNHLRDVGGYVGSTHNTLYQTILSCTWGGGRKGGGEGIIEQESLTRVQNVCACARSLFSKSRLRMRTSQQERLF